MADLFHDKAAEWDQRPIPAQISEGVFRALREAVDFSGGLRVMDFGAGTGLVCSKIAPLVDRVLAVDISEAMLAQLAAKPELQGKVEIRCQDILHAPLGETVDLVVSAMAMHHVEDTDALLRTLHDHLAPGGRVALADLDAEDGSFHPPDTQGVFHAGFDRDDLRARLAAAGFVDVEFTTACEVHRDARGYPIFLALARKG
ncbi:MAG: class I SAM-dependent methyltransferase [Myxococcales bacterium]|nr:class I SAM-dependent methyltransferase [Myxococcales bacterium]